MRSRLGDEFPRRLCDPLPPLTAVLYYRWLAAGLHDKLISQGVVGHRVYVGIRHPSRFQLQIDQVTSCLKSSVNQQRLLADKKLRHCLHGPGFICNRITFDAVKPFVYTAPI